MPRGRMLNKKISNDESVGKLSLEAKLLYTWCIPHLDVKGRLFGNKWALKAIVPYVDEIQVENIPALIEECVSAHLVLRYGDLNEYLQFLGFAKNQKIHEERESASVIPEPPNSGVTHEELMINSSTSKVKVSKVNITRMATPSLDIIISYLLTEKNQTPQGAAALAEQFHSFYESKGWLVGKNRMKNWKAAISGWIVRDKTNGGNNGMGQAKTSYRGPKGEGIPST